MTVPMAQPSHSDAAALLAKCPVAHASHPVACSAAWKNPGVHSSQADTGPVELLLLKYPALHAAHALLPAALTEW